MPGGVGGVTGAILSPRPDWVFLSEKVAVAAGSLEKQEISVFSIDEYPVRFDMAVP
jgi:hypothetical protein